MESNPKKICTTELGKVAWDGRCGLLCRNEITGVEEYKVYKTRAAAKAAATRFEKAMVRIYVSTVEEIQKRGANWESTRN